MQRMLEQTRRVREIRTAGFRLRGRELLSRASERLESSRIHLCLFRHPQHGNHTKTNRMTLCRPKATSRCLRSRRCQWLKLAGLVRCPNPLRDDGRPPIIGLLFRKVAENQCVGQKIPLARRESS
jgi:hypothetical protein